MAADREGPAGIGIGQGCRPVLPVKPALQKPRHEAVARTKHVEDLDGKAWAGLAIVEPVGDITLEGHRPHRAALAHKRRPRHPAHRPQRRDRIRRAARDVELLLGADDEVEEMQHRLQLRRHLR